MWESVRVLKDEELVELKVVKKVVEKDLWKANKLDD